jgi:uncharacterized delta-60 repeat protein
MNPNGTPDASFGGGDGMVTINITGGSYDALCAMTVQPDGKIVAVGYSDNAICVIRVDSTGTLDPGFGTGGIFTTSMSANGHHPRGVVIQNDDKIVVAGNFADSEEELDLFVLRLHPDGVPDSSFADDGVAIVDETAEEGYAVALQSDGKIVVGGNLDITSFYTTIAAFRFNTNGTLDSTFAGDGIATADFGVASFGYSLALQLDGKILVGGEVGDSDVNVAVARFNSDGSLDNAFGGGDGMSTIVVTDSTFDRTSGIALQDDGYIIVAGVTTVSAQDFLVMRLVGSSGPLPVQLSSFTATAAGMKAELRWRTESELENHGFEIERREMRQMLTDTRRYESENDGVTTANSSPFTPYPSPWVSIGFVQGSGTSSSAREYSFTDKPGQPGRYAYRIKQIDQSGTFTYTSTLEVLVGLAPLEFTLSQNYPNPFNPTTTIGFTLAEDGHVVLKVYDMTGREVATLLDEERTAGAYHQVVVDAARLTSGTYFVRLDHDRRSLTRKITVIK